MWIVGWGPFGHNDNYPKNVATANAEGRYRRCPMSEHPQFDFPEVSSLPPIRPEHRRRRVVFVASPTPDPLEFVGPLNVLKIANFVLDHSGRSDLGYDLEVVASVPGVVFEMDGLEIRAEKPYHRLRGEVDTLLFSPMEFDDLFDRSERFLAWVRRMSERVRRIGTICWATYILAEAGVLSGRRVTTHWDHERAFRERYTDVELDIDPIYVKDGNLYTSAGATAGIDMMLALIEEDFGAPVALRVAQALVLFLKRPGDQAQFSVQLSSGLPEDAGVAAVQTYIHEHPEADLRLEVLADRAGMSPRNFSRAFKKEVGLPPGQYVERYRLEIARQRLQDSAASVADVAERCGYGSSEAMRLAFERNLGVSPRAYRQRFTSADRVARSA
jgi:transcriptional regulator GlxA family with amidase domain